MVPFTPSHLYNSVKLIDGYTEFNNEFTIKSTIYYSEAFNKSISDVIEHYSDWSEDQGFGSSDMTYAVKYFIDNMIKYGEIGDYETKFDPHLKIVKTKN